MNDKWKNFRTANSSNLDITKQSESNISAVRADLHRLLSERDIQINNIELNKIGENYNNFKNDNDAQNFINNEILKNFKGNDTQKNKAFEFVSKNLHQGGMLFPVSSALTEKVNKGLNIGMAEDKSVARKINIQATENGFKVQEFCSIGVLMLDNEGPLKGFGNQLNGQMLITEENDDDLIQAQGTVNIDFNEKTDDPMLTIESNNMTINHDKLRETMDDRSIGQIIKDWFVKVFNFKNVEDISKQTEKQEANSPNKENEENNQFRP
tara:strand:+ start:252 stop:1052 length:801 start_codon:yes stop_codon:yes gene_type:complete